ncbi:hypothetical protein Tco_1260667 [Tanacetum coccineum]
MSGVTSFVSSTKKDKFLLLLLNLTFYRLWVLANIGLYKPVEAFKTDLEWSPPEAIYERCKEAEANAGRNNGKKLMVVRIVKYSMRRKPTVVVHCNCWKGGGLIVVGYKAAKDGVKCSMRGDEVVTSNGLWKTVA